MINYEVPSSLLEPFVPAGTVLDLWHGHALVSIVGFRFLNTRLLGIPIPFHRHFDEINLRLYVRRELATGEIRRGVVFIQELVPRHAVALVARLAYNEPYARATMQSSVSCNAGDATRTLAYSWYAPRHYGKLAATIAGLPAHAAPSTEAAFITEHFWGYTRQRDGSAIEYQVLHAPWRIWHANSASLSGNFTELYDAPLASLLTGPPVSAFVAEGSPVSVQRPQPLDPEQSLISGMTAHGPYPSSGKTDTSTSPSTP